MFWNSKMSAYIYYLMGYVDEIEPDERQVCLRNLLMKQIISSNIILKPILKRESVEDKLRELLSHYKSEDEKKIEDIEEENKDLLIVE